MYNRNRTLTHTFLFFWTDIIFKQDFHSWLYTRSSIYLAFAISPFSGGCCCYCFGQLRSSFLCMPTSPGLLLATVCANQSKSKSSCPFPNVFTPPPFTSANHPYHDSFPITVLLCQFIYVLAKLYHLRFNLFKTKL